MEFWILACIRYLFPEIGVWFLVFCCIYFRASLHLPLYIASLSTPNGETTTPGTSWVLQTRRVIIRECVIGLRVAEQGNHRVLEPSRLGVDASKATTEYHCQDPRRILSGVMHLLIRQKPCWWCEAYRIENWFHRYIHVCTWGHTFYLVKVLIKS